MSEIQRCIDYWDLSSIPKQRKRQALESRIQCAQSALLYSGLVNASLLKRHERRRIIKRIVALGDPETVCMTLIHERPLSCALAQALVDTLIKSRSRLWTSYAEKCLIEKAKAEALIISRKQVRELARVWQAT